MVKALSQAEIDRIAAQGRRLLLQDREPPKRVNDVAAWQLGQPIPLVYRGGQHVVKPLSYRDGLALQGADMDLKRWAETPATTREELAEQEAELIEMLALFHSLLDPMPEQNPFADVSPLEVGELLRFFFMCLMMQNARPGAVSPSPISTRLTN